MIVMEKRKRVKVKKRRIMKCAFPLVDYSALYLADCKSLGAFFSLKRI